MQCQVSSDPGEAVLSQPWCVSWTLAPQEGDVFQIIAPVLGSTKLSEG